MLDKILAQIKAWIDRHEPPEPLLPCDACGEPVISPGYVYRGQFFCDVYCCPPTPLVTGGNGQRREITNLAGDPGG